MVLGSQSPRSGMGRRYMVSRRRRTRRWPWVLAAVLVVGLVVVFQPFGGSEDEGDAPAEGNSSASLVQTDAGRAAQTPLEAKPRRVAEMTPPPTLDELRRARRTEQPAPTPTRPADLTLGSPTGTSNPTPPSSRATTTAPVPAAPVPSTATRPLSSEPLPSLRSENAQLRRGMDLIAEEKYVEGRQVLSRLLFDDQVRLSPADDQAVRDTLTSVNRSLVFSPTVHAGDPVSEYYTVQSGDRLGRIASQYGVTYQFLEEVNGIDANRLRVGQKIKLIKGPLHARVVKRDYRMDIFLRAPDGSPLYVRSFRVGLGEGDSTPIGRWMVEPGRKVVNPSWVNPRTNEQFAADDPKNPIGNYWIALKGTSPDTEGHSGYGIHGTIDPDSIGSQASMGCVRMADGDIERVFAMLVEEHSTVLIVE